MRRLGGVLVGIIGAAAFVVVFGFGLDVAYVSGTVEAALLLALAGIVLGTLIMAQRWTRAVPLTAGLVLLVGTLIATIGIADLVELSRGIGLRDHLGGGLNLLFYNGVGGTLGLALVIAGSVVRLAPVPAPTPVR